MSSRSLLRLVAASAPLFAMPAFAEDHYANPIDDRFRLTAGAFFDNVATTLRLDGAAPDSGTPIDLENDLGLADKRTLPDVEFMIAMHDRHRVRLGYFKLDRSTAQTLERDLVIRGDTYQTGDLVESTFNIRMLSLAYSYAIVHNPHIDLAASFGINLLEFNARALVRARSLDQSEDNAGAFPTVGIDLLVPISRRFYGEARAEYLKVDVNDFEGSAQNLHAGIVYRFRENLAFGLGYRKFNISLTSNQVGDTGEFELDNSGAQLYVRVSF
ncbi:MAG TPA: hypothetical protein VE046_18325 [Steroidobacteraceae bacterium]|nr:hypothetical protein [Steroidobacteraceae bacterium]